MSSSKRYSEADRRGRNSNQDLTNIGIAGRKTGLRVEGTRRGSDGFENESAFFSPTTTAKKANAIKDIGSAKSVSSATRNTRSYDDMDLEASTILGRPPLRAITDTTGSAQDVTAALRRRSEGPRSPVRSGIKRAKSPTKTHLNSPALRVRSPVKPTASPPKSALRSPGRPATTHANVKIARKLDFSRTDPEALSGDEDVTVDGSKQDPAAKNLKRKSSSSNISAKSRRSLLSDDDAEDEQVTMNGLQGQDFEDLVQPVEMPNAANDDVRYDTNYEAPNDELDEPFNEYINNEVEDEDNEPARSRSKSPLQTTRGKEGRRSLRGDDAALEAEVEAADNSAEDNQIDEAADTNGEPKTKKRGRPSKRQRTEDETAAAQVAGRKTKVASRSSFSPARTTRERSTRTASPQREWREPVNHESKNGDDDDGTRRSSRFKIAPLAFWRGEKMVYGRGSRRKSIGGTLGLALPEVKEIIHVDLIEGEQVRRRGKASAGRPKKKRSGHGRVKEESESESEYDKDEWEDQIKVEAPVRSFENQNELVRKVLAIPESAYEPRPVVGQGIFFQKTLSEEPHFAAGVLDIPVGASKPPKPSKQNTMFFFIFTGYVEVKIHDVVFRLRKGGQFTVPRGNFYEILNIGKKDARLFFSQSTDTLANHLIAHPELVL